MDMKKRKQTYEPITDIKSKKIPGKEHPYSNYISWAFMKQLREHHDTRKVYEINPYVEVFQFEKNFYGIQKPAVGELQAGLIGGLGIWSLSVFSIIPIAIGGVATLVSHVANRLEMKKAFKTLSTDELHAYIAMKLTLIEESREVMSEEEWKSLADEFLKYISNLRGDAEYNWLIEKVDGKRNKELIELCNLTIAQLSKIIGI